MAGGGGQNDKGERRVFPAEGCHQRAAFGDRREHLVGEDDTEGVVGC
jgi:hypothetical protein